MQKVLSFSKIQDQESENAKLKELVDRLTAQTKQLTAQTKELKGENEELRAYVEKQAHEIFEYRTILDQVELTAKKNLIQRKN